eukprot:9297948-Alexandrium_andersonii.AAC.1
MRQRSTPPHLCSSSAAVSLASSRGLALLCILREALPQEFELQRTCWGRHLHRQQSQKGADDR